MTPAISSLGTAQQRHTRGAPDAMPSKNAKLLGVAKKLESQFISEMLKSAGFGKSRDALGGGAGEEGFSSFLVQAQADKIVEAGGFGLTQKIYETLREQE